MGKDVEIFELWKKHMVATLGSLKYQLSTVQRLSPPDSAFFKRKLDTCRRFQDDFVKLCRRYKFNPLKPDWHEEIIEGESILYPRDSELSRYVAHALVEVLQANEDSIQWQRTASKDRDALRKNRKRGPARRMPIYVAELILIGFELLKDHEPGLQALRKFLVTEIQLIAHRGDEGVRVWCQQIRQDLLRIILSEGKRTIVKNFKGHESEKKKILKAIEEKAKRLPSLPIPDETATYPNPPKGSV